MAQSKWGFKFFAQSLVCVMLNRVEIAVHGDYFTPAARAMVGVAEIERPAIKAVLKVV
ncbi:hypothetical protein [Arthrobacter sp. H14-L1]|uniref:hypothetical protein n=1 Tax=Arthrobacter sp. H14-L1 TaxID=2996697 RepID=UPI0022715710|nr:hypothetical protein [Arthrobacter sp. H14-L1]MCY0906572.1 hypothetical protein [Arthrobacter sp. H14-L1]